MTASTVPVLSDILYYTQSDSYDYLTDNRPIYQLDSNIRTVASFLVASGVGEHTSIAGISLTPGRAVELLPTGQIKYPDQGTDYTTAILGIVIASTNASTSRVVWSAGQLDLAALGLTGVVIPSANKGDYLVVANNSTGVITTTPSPAVDALIVGQVKIPPYVSVGSKPASGSVIESSAAKLNHTNLYGLRRFRNFALALDIGSTPLQYKKRTYYGSSYVTTNPLNVKFNKATGQIFAHEAVSPSYNSQAQNWKIKELYTNFTTGSLAEDVSYYSGVSTTNSTWTAQAYPTTLVDGLTTAANYELQAINNGYDYAVELAKFKSFSVTKFYQYAKVSSSDAVNYGKVTAIITLFSAENGEGGEPTKLLVFDFFEYSSGLEVERNRVILTGASADAAIADTTLFPTEVLV